LAIAWVVFFGTSFVVSTIALTVVQFRGIARYGWRGLRDRPVRETYWRELSRLERGLVWVGFIAFGITWLGLMTWKIATSVGQ
jgi:hypothetical protein